LLNRKERSEEMKKAKKLFVFALLVVSILALLVVSPKSADAKVVTARNDTYTQLNNPWNSYTSFNYVNKNVPNNHYLKNRSYGNLGSKWWNMKYVSHYRWWWNYG